MALTIQFSVVEEDDGLSFRLYDETDWSGYDFIYLSSVVLTATYDGTDYSVTLYDVSKSINLLGITPSYVNLVGESPTAYFEITPDLLVNDDGDAIGTTYFNDGYYEFSLVVTYDDVEYTGVYSAGFLAELTLMASQLPLQIDIYNFNYHENRIQFLLIALINSCKWAASLGKYTQFTQFVEKANALLSNRDIVPVWSS